MARSVDRPSDATWTFYLAVPDWAYEDWQEYLDQFGDLLEGRYRSVHYADRWIGREQHVIAETVRGAFVLCEYCGLASLSFVPKDDLARIMHEGWRA